MILAAHDPNWLNEFSALRSVYTEALGHLIVDIEHVGSTAIPNLLAKPILDIDIVIRDYSVFPQIVAALKVLGYQHNGDQGISQREAFKAENSTAPYTPSARNWMQHHLYVCPAGGTELQRHILFRDALLANDDLRNEYEKIKLRIASISNGDRQTYAQVKEKECRNFVENVLQRKLEASDRISL